MLFNSGTPSLVSYTQTLAGSPATAQSPLFGTQEAKDAVNDAYVMFMELARQTSSGYGVKRAYDDAVADQMFYELPDDFIKMVLVEVDVDGNDLSTTTPPNANIAVPRHEPNMDVLEMRERNLLSEAQYYFYHGGAAAGTRHFGIAEAPETAGTNSIRITYEASAEELSGDTDEPMIPQNYHRLIARRAAYLLRLQNDLPVRDLERNVSFEMSMFRKAVARVAQDVDWQIPLAGRTSPTYHATTTGFTRKI